MALTRPVGLNYDAAATRAARGAYGENIASNPKTPDLLNNEALQSVNAAGTAAVDLVKLNASDQVVHMAGGVNRMVFNPTAKTIVDGSATSLFEVACAASAMAGGLIFYQVQASDGTDFQSLVGMVSYSVVNKAGTLTLTITEVAGNQAKAVSSGTLTLAWTFVTGTSKGTVKLQPTGSLTETSYTVTYTVLPITGAVTIL